MSNFKIKHNIAFDMKHWNLYLTSSDFRLSSVLKIKCKCKYTFVPSIMILVRWCLAFWFLLLELNFVVWSFYAASPSNGSWTLHQQKHKRQGSGSSGRKRWAGTRWTHSRGGCLYRNHQTVGSVCQPKLSKRSPCCTAPSRRKTQPRCRRLT